MLSFVDAGEERRWFRFLSRWSLFAGVVYLGLLLVMIFGVMPASQNSTLPEEYFELGAAIESPAVYRLAIALDVAAWLALGGFFVAFAAILIPRAPVRGVLVAACGAGQVIGLAGAYLRLSGTSDLAARYEGAAPDRREALLDSYLDLQLVVSSHFDAGALLWSTALILVASATWSVAGFPRWLAALIGLPGILQLANAVFSLVTGLDYLAFLFILALLLLIAGFFTLAWRFWRKTPGSTPEGGDASG